MQKFTNIEKNVSKHREKREGKSLIEKGSPKKATPNGLKERDTWRNCQKGE